jgi:hypothetical protein
MKTASAVTGKRATALQIPVSISIRAAFHPETAPGIPVALPVVIIPLPDGQARQVYRHPHMA